MKSVLVDGGSQSDIMFLEGTREDGKDQEGFEKR